MSRLTIFDKNGYFIGDIRAATVRSWTIPATGIVGECAWDMSLFDSKAALKYIDFVKYVLVRHPTLPPWIGFIYTPQNWGYQSITVRAYQIDGILKYRTMPDQTIADTPGELWREILQTTNAIDGNEKPIRPNYIYGEGSLQELSLSEDAFTSAVTLAAQSGNDFEVSYDFDSNGRLYLKGNWYESAGQETSYWLREGSNVELVSDPLTVQGDLFNELVGYSDAFTAETRLRFIARNEQAVSRFGLFQGSSVFNKVDNMTVLQNATVNYLYQTMNGQYAFDPVALNVGDTFKYLRPGNTLNLDLNRAGFSPSASGFGYNGAVRIISMEYDDLADRVKLNVEAYDA